MKNYTIFAMALATLLTTTMMSGNAAAQTCKSFTAEASGSSAGAVAKFRKRRAKRRAKRAWEKKIAYHFGGRFSDIDDARHVHFSCGLTPRGNTLCTVTATPCTE